MYLKADDFPPVTGLLANALMLALRGAALSAPRADLVRTFPLTHPFSVNHMFIQRGPIRVKSPEYKKWRTEQMQVMMACGMRRQTITDPVELVLVVPDSFGDIDNTAKAYIDALQSMNILANDRQVRNTMLLRGATSGKGFIFRGDMTNG